MSSKLKSYLLLATALILFGVLAYLLKDVTRGNSPKNNLYDAKYYNDKANSLIMKEQFDEAITNFNKAIEISKDTPQFYVSYTGRAHAKYNLKDCNGTISDAKIALTGKDLAPEDRGDMFSLIGVCEYINSDYKKSIEDLTTAINLTPKNDPFSWTNFAYRGASKLVLKDYDSGKDDLFTALKLNKNVYIIYDFIYTYYINTKDYKSAILYFEKVGQFHENIDERYYQNGLKIYFETIAKKQETDPEKIELYKKLAFEYGNKAYNLKKSAENLYKLCLAKIVLNNETSPDKTCFEARDKANQEKNDALYKEIDDAINMSVN